jgi:hypothetical protein
MQDDAKTLDEVVIVVMVVKEKLPVPVICCRQRQEILKTC